MFCAAVLLWVPAGHAALAVCTGKIESITSRPGYVYVKLDTINEMAMCSVDVQFFRYSPASCKDLKSNVMLAFATARSVTAYVDNAPTGDCSSITPGHNADIQLLLVN